MNSLKIINSLKIQSICLSCKILYMTDIIVYNECTDKQMKKERFISSFNGQCTIMTCICSFSSIRGEPLVTEQCITLMNQDTEVKELSLLIQQGPKV